jgi:hypothetical protein
MLPVSRFTGLPDATSVKVAAFIEAAFMALLNVADMLALGETPVARFAGIVDTTVGTASFVPVLNVQT